MRTFQSAFHANADQEQWYGWAPLKETAVKIKSEDRSLRAEAELAEAVKAAAESGASAQGTPGFEATLMGVAFVAMAVLLRRRG